EFIRHRVHSPQSSFATEFVHSLSRAATMVFWSCSTVEDSRLIVEQLVFTGGRIFLVIAVQ
ncbi:MAG: hypothetical protein OSB12_09205, partial [Planctomycetota bacterium]|nr:hypothetical protein [Planctomycetota bacterium]